MKKAKKHIFSFMLALVMFFSLLPVSALTGHDSYVVYIVADQATNNTRTELGTTSGDGKVWTDKTVKVNDSNFDVTLSALAQEYISTSTTSTVSNTAADVLLILDITGSMSGTSGTDIKHEGINITRLKAMTLAVNDAMKIILEANNKNRVMVTMFGASCVTFLDLDHYSVTGDGDYIYVDGNIIKTGATLKDGNNNTVNKSQTQISSTYTQQGIYYGMQKFLEATSGETFTITREPFVLMLTDGEATRSFSDWYGTHTITGSSTQTVTFTGTQYSNTNKAEVAATTILTAAYLKNQINTQYNTKNDKGVKTNFYTVGLGGDVATNDIARPILNPSGVYNGGDFNKDGVSESSALATSVLTAINSAVTSAGADYSSYNVGSNYVYVDADYYFLADKDYSDLEAAFTKLSSEVKTATQSVITPITTTGGSGDASIVFTDVLGTGMELKNAPKLGSVTGTGSVSGSVTTYTFTDYESTATYNSSNNTLIWTLPAKELPLVKFANRTPPQSGSYSNPSQSPITLNYTVGAASTTLSGTYYSNAFTGTDSKTAQTTAVFTAAKDNTYYYNVTPASGETPMSSTPKAAPAAVAKVTNSTGTAANSSSYAWGTDANSGVMTVTLGNNGKMTVVAKIEMTANTISPKKGESVTYAITITNFTNSILNLGVTATIPSGMIYEVTSEGGIMVGGSPIWSDIAIPADNGTASVYFIASISGSAAVGTQYSNTAQTIDTTNATVSNTVTVTVAGTYSATVTVKKDDVNWTSTDGAPVIKLKNDSTAEVYDNGAQVANGTYSILANGEDTGSNIVVSNADAAVDLNYYTVTVAPFYATFNNVTGAYNAYMSGDTGGTVYIDSSGTTSKVYLNNSTASITAMAATDYSFDEWKKSGTQVSTSTTYSPTVTAKETYEAYFKQETVTFTVIPQVNGDITLKYWDGDSWEYVIGGKVVKGTEIQVTATPDTNYNLTKLTVGGSDVTGTKNGSDTTYEFTINSDTTISALFSEQGTLTYVLDGGILSAGSYTPAGKHSSETVINLPTGIETKKSGYTFYGWKDSTGTIYTNSSKPSMPADGSSLTLTAVWTYNPPIDEGTGDTIKSTTNSGGTITPNGITTNKTFKITADQGHRILDVLVNGKSMGAVDSYTFDTLTGSDTITATFTNANNYIIDAKAIEGGSVSNAGRIAATPNSTATYYFTPDEGYRVYDVLVNGKSVGACDSYTFIEIIEDYEIIPLFSAIAQLNDTDHFAYIIGYPDGNILPGANITRAEAATIFYRLLTEESRELYDTQENEYSDVAEGMWFNRAISTLSAAGILMGYEDGTFRPSASITRAEFAVIASRFDDITYSGDTVFSDIEGHWAQREISSAAAKGWVTGYPEGTFAPNKSITRAETMTLVNRVLSRQPESADDLYKGMTEWPDNPSDAWYYLAVQEATNSHNYTKKDDGFNETWTGLRKNRDWSELEK